MQKTILKYLKGFLYFLVPFIVLLLIISTLYYFDILNNQVIKYFKIVIILLSALSGGFYVGRKSENKGYLSGFKLSLGIIILFLIINLIMRDFKWYHLVYYLIISITTCIGSMIGINKKQ